MFMCVRVTGTQRALFVCEVENILNKENILMLPAGRNVALLRKELGILAETFHG